MVERRAYSLPATEVKNRFGRVLRELAEAAFGMWSARTDIDDEWLKRGRSRWQSEWSNG